MFRKSWKIVGWVLLALLGTVSLASLTVYAATGVDVWMSPYAI